jgi:hypothetical protein
MNYAPGFLEWQDTEHAKYTQAWMDANNERRMKFNAENGVSYVYYKYLTDKAFKNWQLVQFKDGPEKTNYVEANKTYLHYLSKYPELFIDTIHYTP